MAIVRLNIDGIELTGYKGQTILEVALENGILIPSLCYDKRIDVYGSCGMCVVEMDGAPKLLRACATEITDGMILRTDTPRVRESRKVNLELLLSQHTGDCRAPCVMACPARTDCQGYIGLIANGETEEALKLIKNKIPFAASIGRVCPHPCEEACRRRLVDEPVSILNLKRFAADADLSRPAQYLPEAKLPTGKSVGIIGGGPGGLSCAYYLAGMGHSVTVFDAMPKMGGMLRYGIPEYRLPKEIVDKEAALVEKAGVTFRNNVRVGAGMTFESLRGDYDAMVVAIGAWDSLPLRCPGSELSGVYGGIEFLRKAYANEPVSIGRNVAVIGGGNTAMDACRTAVRLGAEKVFIIYRRTGDEMPADKAEVEEAAEEGVVFKYLVNPLEITGEAGRASGLRLQKMRLGDPDASGRRRPEPVEGEEETLEVDTVIAALGQGIVSEGFSGISLTRGNTIIADENVFTTSEKGVFAIGDCINDGAAIAIKAIGDAKRAAAAIDFYLRGFETVHKEPYRVTRDDLTDADFADIKKEPRSQARILSPDERKGLFLETTQTFDGETARKEAARCLECGCGDFFECKLISLAETYDVDPVRFSGNVPEFAVNEDHPFILRDPNKCVLCGLCVRACAEIIGAAALGFADRGFETVVTPAFGDALSGTDCVSCGQCIAVCPTGAMQERISFRKPVPLDTVKTGSICGMCAVGCSVQVESYGSTLIKTTSLPGAGVNDGVLCGRGRFGTGYVQKDGRITAPMIRTRGELMPAGWRDAFVYTAKKMESLRARGMKTAVSIGHGYCIEDAGAIKNLAELLGAGVFSFMNRENGLARVLGGDGSPNTLEEITGCDHIFIFGSALVGNPVIVSKLRLAARCGAAVTVISIGDDEFNLPCSVVKSPNSTIFIKQIIKAMIDAGATRNVMSIADGFEELCDSLSAVEPCEEAKTLAADYMAAGRAMIAFELAELSVSAAVELANMAVAGGHIGNARNGIFLLRQMAGSQILADFGITGQSCDAEGAKGLMVFGEDAPVKPDGLEFLMVQDTHMTRTAAIADVVFPLAYYPEIEGTLVNTERRLQHCKMAIAPPVEYRTSEIAAEIARVLESGAAAGSVQELYPNAEPGQCFPSPVLYTDGFGFPDKRAKLQVTGEAPMIEVLPQTCNLINAVTDDLP